MGTSESNTSGEEKRELTELELLHALLLEFEERHGEKARRLAEDLYRRRSEPDLDVAAEANNRLDWANIESFTGAYAVLCKDLLKRRMPDQGIIDQAMRTADYNMSSRTIIDPNDDEYHTS